VIDVEASGWAMRLPTDLEIFEGDTVRILLILMVPSVMLRGKVTERSTGRAIEGAVVVAFTWRLSLATATTKDDGSFSLGPVSTEFDTLETSYPGLIRSSVSSRQLDLEAPIAIELTRGERRMRGVVRDAEAPIEAARFLVLDPGEWERGRDPIILGTSGADGRFELFVEGYPQIRVEAEGYRPLDIGQWDEPTEVVLERASRLTGTLTTHDGLAVPGARVRAKCGSQVMLPDRRT
jgi:hypothetical protein